MTKGWRTRRSLSLVLASAACSPFSTRSPPPPKPVPLPEIVKGANLRPVGDERRGYGTATARRTLERLSRLGVNTIAVLMEGRMADLSDRTVDVASRGELDPIRRMLLDANELGFATVVVPHIYFDDGSWRGDLALDDAADEWWTSYETFMLTAADIATASGATALSVGVELKALSSRPETRVRFARLVERVRAEYDGLLTYSANWDEAESVPFWDLVDIVGVNGYYPLQPEPVRGAEAVARRLQALSLRTDRPVLVLEAGYRSGPLSHVRPWEWPEDLQPLVDLDSQARSWAAVLAQWLGTPGVRGVMIWVVPTDPDDPASEPPHGFNPLNKPAEDVIARAFGGDAPRAER